MIFALKKSVNSQTLANELGLAHLGEAVDIKYIASLDQLEPGCLGFSVALLSASRFPAAAILITPPPESRDDVNHAKIISNRPRLDFVRALQWLKGQAGFPDPGAGHIEPTACIHSTAVIEAGAVVGAGCRIGPYTHIYPWVVLAEGVSVGSHCVIGHDGFGYEFEEQGEPIHFPHFGRVCIGRGATVGNLCSISRGTLSDTIISAQVKMDDQVYIAHNVQVGESSMLMSGCRLNGRVKIGRNCWIGTGALVREGLCVHSGAMVGMGSVIVKDVESETTVAGNPGRILTGESR